MRTSIAALCRLIHRLDVTPSDLVAKILERIEEFDEELHTYLTLNSRIGEEARRLTLELKNTKTRGPLHGIPISVKDLIDTAGIRTTYGSRFYRRNVQQRDSAVVRSLKASGALIIGKTNCDEFGLGMVTLSTRNSWDNTRIAGGSSGGSAAALGADLAVFALGRIPGAPSKFPRVFAASHALSLRMGSSAWQAFFQHTGRSTMLVPCVDSHRTCHCS
jgi:aspartyl-tRNA(Asn)/glutamyl-tRNA(Gln) amidotransferase subunit A